HVLEDPPVAEQSLHAASLVVELRRDLVPPAMLLAHEPTAVNPHALEEDLVEVVLPDHVDDRTHRDAGPAHVDEELADSFVLWRLRVGARDEIAVLSFVRVGGPDLMAVDDEEVAVFHGPRAERREVASRVRLAHADREEELTTRDAREQ